MTLSPFHDISTYPDGSWSNVATVHVESAWPCQCSLQPPMQPDLSLRMTGHAAYQATFSAIADLCHDIATQHDGELAAAKAAREHWWCADLRCQICNTGLIPSDALCIASVQSCFLRATPQRLLGTLVC